MKWSARKPSCRSSIDTFIVNAKRLIFMPCHRCTESIGQEPIRRNNYVRDRSKHNGMEIKCWENDTDINRLLTSSNMLYNKKIYLCLQICGSCSK